jgi:Family of unknown function (DUF5684)
MPIALLSRMAQDYGEPSAGGGIFGGFLMIVWLAVAILVIAGVWKVFTKAGQPGWASIIPIYNIIVLLQIAGRPIWWFILMLIPAVNVIVAIIVSIDVAKHFGKGTGYGVGLAILPFIFYPALGFGSATYSASAS